MPGKGRDTTPLPRATHIVAPVTPKWAGYRLRLRLLTPLTMTACGDVARMAELPARAGEEATRVRAGNWGSSPTASSR